MGSGIGNKQQRTLLKEGCIFPMDRALQGLTRPPAPSFSPTAKILLVRLLRFLRVSAEEIRNLPATHLGNFDIP